MPYFCLIGQSSRRALSRLTLSGQLLSGAKRCCAGAGAAAAVADAVGAGAVPRHPDEERPVVAEVGRPPVLRVGHQRVEVLLQGLEVELLELLGVVELLAHGIGQGGVLVEDLEVQLVRPPVPVRPASNVVCMTGHLPALLRHLSVHVSLRSFSGTGEPDCLALACTMIGSPGIRSNHIACAIRSEYLIEMITLRQLRYLPRSPSTGISVSRGGLRHYPAGAVDAGPRARAYARRRAGRAAAGRVAVTDAGLKVARRASSVLAAARDLVDFARQRDCWAGSCGSASSRRSRPTCCRACCWAAGRYPQLRWSCARPRPRSWSVNSPAPRWTAAMLALPDRTAGVARWRCSRSPFCWRYRRPCAPGARWRGRGVLRSAPASCWRTAIACATRRWPIAPASRGVGADGARRPANSPR